METAKYKMKPPATTKAMIKDFIADLGGTNVRYSGKLRTFFYTDSNGKEEKWEVSKQLNDN